MPPLTIKETRVVSGVPEAQRRRAEGIGPSLPPPPTENGSDTMNCGRFLPNACQLQPSLTYFSNFAEERTIFGVRVRASPIHERGNIVVVGFDVAGARDMAGFAKFRPLSSVWRKPLRF
ncbi:uncharacterized protein [Physcomitrium patens]|uniref:uncharacterized protein n=1 Tax=Physcomitrium patens TaxID=3218 RepID=UPI003CCDB2ED